MKSLIRSALLILLTCLLMAVPAQAEDIAAEWARILRDALDRAHGAGKK